MLLPRSAINKVYSIYDTLRPNLKIQKGYTKYEFIDLEMTHHTLCIRLYLHRLQYAVNKCIHNFYLKLGYPSIYFKFCCFAQILSNEY